VFKEKNLPANLAGRYHYYNSTSGYYYFGYCIDLIYHINNSDSLQFEFTLLEQEDGAYGTMQANNTWNGMINELIQDVRTCADATSTTFTTTATTTTATTTTTTSFSATTVVSISIVIVVGSGRGRNSSGSFYS